MYSAQYDEEYICTFYNKTEIRKWLCVIIYCARTSAKVCTESNEKKKKKKKKKRCISMR